MSMVEGVIFIDSVSNGYLEGSMMAIQCFVVEEGHNCALSRTSEESKSRFIDEKERGRRISEKLKIRSTMTNTGAEKPR